MTTIKSAIGNWQSAMTSIGNRQLAMTLVISLFAAADVSAQTPGRPTSVAVIDFGDSSIGRRAAETLTTNLSTVTELNILDRDLTRSAVKGAGYSGSLNLSVTDAHNLGAALGSDFYILGDAQTLRRSPSTGDAYFDSYASLFLVSARTGKLILWLRPNSQAATAAIAESRLIEDLSNRSSLDRLTQAIQRTVKEERNIREQALAHTAPLIEEAPDDENTATAQGLRLPRPYRRLVPRYPDTAAVAEAEATVDVLVDLDEKGEVQRVEIARWAGFGLDEATIDTVRQLHFFPAMRNGTPIPLRVLLRYNFRKPAK
ncbi:MAG TPA: energy transducer TonB [Pyrinomonadaceae bacterium]|nr:energy transducer TonB [Pyrinomonadaceae bacterium]